MIEQLQNDAIQVIAELRAASAVLVLSGAGASADSGIPTFRGSGSGWWTGLFGYPVLGALGTARGWELMPSWINRPLYNRYFLETVKNAQPNAFHRVIATLDKAYILTQNVDGLHQKAGSPVHRVAELHGTVLDDGMCVCGEPFPCAKCWGGGKWRPSALLFLDPHGRTEASARQENLLKEIWRLPGIVILIVGLSGMVGSGNYCVDLLRNRGALVIHVNPAENLSGNTFYRTTDRHLRYKADAFFAEIEHQIQKSS